MPVREPYPDGDECPECGDCHLGKRNGDIYCRICGWDETEDEEVPRTEKTYKRECKSCDRDVTAAANYCPWCGSVMGIGEDETEDDLRERVERLEAGMSETASLVEELEDRLREGGGLSKKTCPWCQEKEMMEYQVNGADGEYCENCGGGKVSCHREPEDVESESGFRSSLQSALGSWMDEHRFRPTIPSPEYWPEDVNSRDEATEHYSRLATDEIIEEL